VVQIGVVFLSGEKEVDYTWALEQLRNIMAKNSVEEPLSIVTDRELALIKVLDTLFLRSIHLLCRWHVNINVLAKTKKFFPPPIKDSDSKVKRHPKFQEFLSWWNILLASTTKKSYNDQLIEMRRKFPAQAMSYVEAT